MFRAEFELEAGSSEQEDGTIGSEANAERQISRAYPVC